MIGKLLKSRYELVGLIQDGPIFATYSARDRIQGRDLSIRVLKQPFAQESDFVDRLTATIRKFTVIQSASVERLTGVESDDGVTYVLGDLTRGPSLGDRIRKLAPFSIPVSVGTTISILHALDSVHRHGLVHGDLNPQNLAVMADGDVRLQLTGVWEAYSSSQTAGVLVLPGMAPYLAPEISAGAMPTSGSDVYAVGIVLYELIAGHSPYRADSPLAMALQHSTAPTPNLRAMSLAVPVVLDEIVKKAMAKDPAQRYESAGDMLADLRMLQDSLRFGRSLSWPLRAETMQGSSPAHGRGPAAKPQPVAPKMSAIRRAAEPDAGEWKRKERDVPIWMLVIFTVGLTLFLSCLFMWFYDNLSRPVWITVPNIRNLSITEATSLLKESKLTLRIARREPSDKVEQDNILDVEPEPGTKIREGEAVRVTVSSGLEDVAVPELHGLTVDKAKALLGTLNLALSDQLTSMPDPKLAVGLIVKSDPDARTKIARQSVVRVFVSSGPSDTTQPGDTTQPNQDQNQTYVFTLRLHLRTLPHQTLIRVDMADDSGTRTIYERMHGSYDRFDVTARSQSPMETFNIYYDGVRVDSKDYNAEGKQGATEVIRPDSPPVDDNSGTTGGDTSNTTDTGNTGADGQ